MSERENVVRVELDFSGTGLQLLGWGLLATILCLFVLPAAWGAVPLYAWLFRNIRRSDGARVEFLGRPSEVWILFAVTMFLAYLPQIGASMAGEEHGNLVTMSLTLLLMPLSSAVGLAILRWTVMNISLENAPPLTFTGTYGAYLGWNILIFLSWFTIIGWAWAMTGFSRWLCGNLEAEDLIVSFEGKGLDLLWRGIAAFVMCMPIVTAPWVIRWLTAWFIRNACLYRREAS